MLSTISTLNTVKPPLFNWRSVIKVPIHKIIVEKNCVNETSFESLCRGHLLAIPAPITSISGQQALDNLSLASF